MKALVWHGTHDVRIDTVPDPQILHPTDCIVKVTLSAICGSDLHLYDGYIPTMKSGDILGHEFMGEVVEVGSDVIKVQKGDRVVIPFPIACGQCLYCQTDRYSLCDNSNPKAELQEKAYGFAGAGIYGYSHMMGGFSGGQAEYVRVPYADVGPYKVPEGLTDEQVLFLTDIYPTGYQAADNCDIKEGDTVAVWGCGPVGLFAQVSARMMGARVIAIDRFPERLEMARQFVDGVETVNYEEGELFDTLKTLTNGRGPEAVIDAVGMEAHSMGVLGVLEKVEQNLRLETDRAAALREAIQACGKGGVVSIPGVYGGVINHFNFGAAFNKGLQFRMGQTHVHRYLPELMRSIQEGRLDPSYIITHKVPLDRVPEMYDAFRDKKDDCVKVVIDPSWAPGTPVEKRTGRLAAAA